MKNSVLKDCCMHLETPAYIFDIDEFKERAMLVKSAFGDKTGICFSVKANPFLLKNLPKCFDKIEVCSPGELTICEKTGIDMKKVIFSGVNKTYADVERAMDDGVGVFTAESLLHMELINNAARKRSISVPVLLRLTGGSQFGMDEKDIIEIINNRNSYEGIVISGLHYFTGTQKTKPAVIQKELDYLQDFINKISEEYGFKFENLEYGTGLAVDYFSEYASEKEKERLEEIAAFIRKMSEMIHITVEMGRFFAAPCGYYLTKVMDTKTNCGINYAILDGGINQLKYDGQLYGMQIPEIYHIPAENADFRDADEKWTLCGSLCTTADILAKNVLFRHLQIGDILVFKRTGAYSAMEGMALFLSREMPAVSVFSDENGLEIVRRTIMTDVFNTPCVLL